MNRHVDPQSLHPAEWSVAEAKARFSEVVARAKAGEPQHVTRYGKSEVVVVSVADWAAQGKDAPQNAKAVSNGGSLYDLFEDIRESGAGEELSLILDEIQRERRGQPIDPSLIED